METKYPQTFLHFLSTRGNSGCESRCTRSGQLAADDLSTLPRACHTGTGANVVFDCAEPCIKHCADFSAQIECVRRKGYTLRFSKEIAVSNADELEHRKFLLRQI